MHAVNDALFRAGMPVTPEQTAAMETARLQIVRESQSDLRDRLAMAALTGLLAQGGFPVHPDDTAANAYIMADAMLRAK